MRLLLALTLLLVAFTTQATEINCYSGKVRVYHGYGSDFIFDDNFIAFTENKTSNLIIIDADCIIMTTVSEDKVYASSTGKKEYWS